MDQVNSLQGQDTTKTVKKLYLGRSCQTASHKSGLHYGKSLLMGPLDRLRTQWIEALDDVTIDSWEIVFIQQHLTADIDEGWC